ncbi:MAG: hypothetical protein IPO60_18340 [Flavobacteriales bacterium]|nr:hypothetical protein [Flavobacteriales bacterium]
MPGNSRQGTGAEARTTTGYRFFHGRGRSLQWGIEARTRRIEDRPSEWYMVDSAGYSIPHQPAMSWS